MDMLRNRFYIGEVHVPAYKGSPAQYVKGKHDPIISKDTFYKVQDILDGKQKHTPQGWQENSPRPIFT